METQSVAECQAAIIYHGYKLCDVDGGWVLTNCQAVENCGGDAFCHVVGGNSNSVL